MWLFRLGLLAIFSLGWINADICSWDNCPKWNSNSSIMNVHLIPHTHDDLGWQVTADEYYRDEVRYIFNTMVYELAKDPNRKFSYCETGYLKRWLDDYPDTGVDILKKLIQNGQLEIIGGGWVQPDEAASHYIELIDQYSLGLRILDANFGPCAHPKTAWQIDPFGHSREHANLMAMMGYESLWFAREHFIEHENRKTNKSLQMIWHTSDDLNNTILTGAFFSHYNAPDGFCFDIQCDNDPIQDNQNLENDNLNERLATFVSDLITMNATLLHNHIMILMGDDFTYQDANMWYTNIDKLIMHLNQNYSNILTAFYSTPTCYAQAIKNISTIQWPEKHTDFFPYASGPDSYWTGYFTSKPTVKGIVRKSSALLQLARQLQSVALTSNITGHQIETLEKAVALSQHHDAITGTSKQDVTQDYIMRLLLGWTAVEEVINNAMQTISQNGKNNSMTFPTQIICRNINESECLFTRDNSFYTVTVHNVNGQTLNTLVKVPLYEDTNNVIVLDSEGNHVDFQLTNVFYNPGQINNTNIAFAEISFMVTVLPIGFRTYFLTVNSTSSKLNNANQNILSVSTNSISNEFIQVDFDVQGRLSTFIDLTTNKSYPLAQEFSYYHGASFNQPSGAYVFRPSPQSTFGFSDDIYLQIVNASIVQEARQIISPWVSQTIRLIPGKKYVEFEWTIGPIPNDGNISKEVITTYGVENLNSSGVFWTDANGRQLMKRIRNYAEDFTYQNVDPISDNYYPINSRIVISDGNTSLAILTDRSHGGSSIKDGQVEIMLHRRDFYDDGFGVSEPLNELGRDGRGLVVRGKHWLVVGDAAAVTRLHRILAYEMFHEPFLTFSTYTSPAQYQNDFVTNFNALQPPLFEQINVLTLKQVDTNHVLLRLEHIFQKNEDSLYSYPVTFNLGTILIDYNITQAEELSLGGNAVLSNLNDFTIIINPMEIKTYLLTVYLRNNSLEGSTAAPVTTSSGTSGTTASGISSGATSSVTSIGSVPTTPATTSGPDVCAWNNCPNWSNNSSIWNIHFIPHTHDDLGWLTTVDEYYSTEVRYIFNTFTTELEKDPNRRFTYCETGYLKRWLEDYSDANVDILKKFIQNGQLEIIGGGWVQPDEAASHYYELLDVYTLGLRTLDENFGKCAHPKTGWQIDPFGHSREHANLLAMMGYESVWFAREHYLEHENRKANRSLQMQWHTSDDNSNTILTGVFYAHYSAPGDFCFDIRCSQDPIQDNPNLENYNADQRISEFVNYLTQVNVTQQTNHFMVLMGDDFNYIDANMYFTNLDKLIKYLNANYSHMLTASYSTPACYAQAIKNISTIQWPEKRTDFFPYASGPDSYWTGYFTSKPGMKRFVRQSSALLQLTRQLQSIALTSWSNQTFQQIDTLERAVALSQHHDAVPGTSKEFVTQDYIYRMSKGWTVVEQVLNSAMQTISQGVKNNSLTLSPQIVCRTINESECSFTRDNNIYTVTVHNGNGQDLNTLVKVPLYHDANGVTVTDSYGNSIKFQITNVFANPSQLNNTNVANYEISFPASIRPLGFRTYFVAVTPSLTKVYHSEKHNLRSKRDSSNKINSLTSSISNGLIQLDFDTVGRLSTFHDLATGENFTFEQQFLYYHGAHGGQNSGAYVFRPDPNTPFNFSGLIDLNIVTGPLVNEARQIISPWVSQVIRLLPNKKYVEFEWTIGPIPKDDQVSKEVITTYTIPGLQTNGTFWTDANGRQLMERQRNWAESYTYIDNEPVAGNYYPIDSRILISDGITSMAILTDRAEGGGSINDGQIEIMLHRRDFYDDGYGVNEALNEPGRDGRGLVVRGKHWLLLGNSAEVTKAHRSLAYEMFHAPVLTFATYPTIDDYRNNFVTDFSGIKQGELAPGVNLLTLKQLDANNILIRLEHIYQKNEMPQQLAVDLKNLIPNYQVTQIQELSLAGNEVLNQNASSNVFLQPMDIRTFKLTVLPGSYQNQPTPQTTTASQTTSQQSGSETSTQNSPSGSTCSWNNCPQWSTDPNKWNIHFIPHTHDDLGWLKTVDEYYSTEVRYIFNTMTWELAKNSNRRFTYCETGYLTRWIEENPDGIDALRKLIQNGQLEILGGGWVQPDEAASHYVELIDQYTLGLRKLNDTFGECTHSKAAWQIDPFGHSREHANLMTLMGYESLWFAREHYLERDVRFADKSLQTIWHVSEENNNTILTGNFYAHYSAPSGFSFDIQSGDDPIQDNPNLENYNLNDRLTTFVNYIQYESQFYPHKHFMVLMGDDFMYQDAYMYFKNIDKLIYHLNQNYSNILTAFYSTPACYTQALKSLTNLTWTHKHTDFFPLANDGDSFWTGYFTSRPSLKGLVRTSSELLQLARQYQAITLTWTPDSGKQIEILERAVALSQHHDAVAGTALEFVSQDYIYRMCKGWTAVEPVINTAMQAISQSIKNNDATLPTQIICRTINESECAFTRTNNMYTITVHNGNTRQLESLVKIPLYENTDQITVSDANGNNVNYQLANVFENPGQLNNSNTAPYEINFMTRVNPLGFRTYFVNYTPSTMNKINEKNERKKKFDENSDIMPPIQSISNGLIQLEFDPQGRLRIFNDLTTGEVFPLNQEFFYYHGYNGNNGTVSSAYMFRPDPNNKAFSYPGPISLKIVNGSVINEARQIVSPWVSQVIRLIPNKKYVEFEWTIGPIPSDDGISKEVITTYTMPGLKNNGIFWTDANGRQLLKRQRNWAENYVYENTQPIAGNYYPINSRIILSDGITSMAVLTDRSHGGSSINDGQAEIMLHRREINNEYVQLNEPGRDGRGLVVRGKHWLVVGAPDEVTRVHRTLAYEMFHSPVLTFSTYSSNDLYRYNFVTDYSGLQQPFPENVNLLTLKQLDPTNVLIRLEHIFQNYESASLSGVVRLYLNDYFGFKIVQVQELSLAANNIVNPIANTTVILNPMDIRTYQLTVQIGSPSPSTIGSPSPFTGPATPQSTTLAGNTTNISSSVQQTQPTISLNTKSTTAGTQSITYTPTSTKSNGEESTKLSNLLVVIGLILLTFFIGFI